MKYSLKNETIKSYNETSKQSFPKYTTQLMNCANQNAQGTRPAVVGQLSELFPEFMESDNEMTIEAWKDWYLQKYPEALNKATERIFAQIRNLQEAIKHIDENMVRRWVEDLVISKTFNGLYVQKAILASLADRTESSYRLATPEEESQGIDGFVGETPYSVKPDTYQAMDRLPESIEVKKIIYSKTKTGVKIEVEE